MTANNAHTHVADTIRSQAKAQATRRYAASLPQYRVVTQLPRHLEDMLKQLERAESAERSN